MKSIFEQLGDTYHEENGYLNPRFEIARGKRTDDRHMGTAAFRLSETAPQGYIYQSAHKRQAQERFHKTHRGHETGTGHNRTAKGR